MTQKTTQKDKKGYSTAHLRHVRVAPRKMRKVADLVRGMSASEAEAQLSLLTRRGSDFILKSLRSAIANGENNHDMDRNKMIIKEIKIDEGRKIKRLFPRAFGRGDIKEKKMSHITIILEEGKTSGSSRFIMPSKDKKANKETDTKKSENKDKNIDTDTVEQKKEDTSKKAFQDNVAPKKEKSSFANKVFRRKSI